MRRKNKKGALVNFITREQDMCYCFNLQYQDSVITSAQTFERIIINQGVRIPELTQVSEFYS